MKIALFNIHAYQYKEYKKINDKKIHIHTYIIYTIKYKT